MDNKEILEIMRKMLEIISVPHCYTFINFSLYIYIYIIYIYYKKKYLYLYTYYQKDDKAINCR